MEIVRLQLSALIRSRIQEPFSGLLASCLGLTTGSCKRAFGRSRERDADQRDLDKEQQHVSGANHPVL
jgi:hypothetical protein